MQTRQEAIQFCNTLDNVYEDYPFHDPNWTVMRHKANGKMFAAIFSRNGQIWINVKCDPKLTYMWRSGYAAVAPAYHMNKYHWNSIILDGTVPDDAVKTMIADSYVLTKQKRRANKQDR